MDERGLILSISITLERDIPKQNRAILGMRELLDAALKIKPRLKALLSSLPRYKVWVDSGNGKDKTVYSIWKSEDGKLICADEGEY